LSQLPVGPPHDGRTAGLAFEMYYLMGNFVPWREPAWALLHERSVALLEKCAAAAQQEHQLDVFADAAGRIESIAGKLAAHVPDGTARCRRRGRTAAAERVGPAGFGTER